MGRLTIALALSLLCLACEPEAEPEPVGGQECYDLFIAAVHACQPKSGDQETWQDCLADVMEPASEDAAELADLTIQACFRRDQTVTACVACQQAQARCYDRRSPLVCF